ncbi:MAG: hypothetical protein JNK76_03305 [Planctomycetales bacterium]|nr:hypothetical protein [Planctomycetales bacterium]
MPWLQRIPAGPWIVLGTLFLTAVVYIVRGDALFSPGSLRDMPAGKKTLGGVRSHAELADRCSACHATSESGLTMESLCLGCHTDVHSQIDRRLPLHGRLTDAESCRKCHTEHRGSQATLTDFAHFDHGITAFPLTGKHQLTNCSVCHKDQTYKGTPQSCIACHAEPPVHVGRFGTNCSKCHSTATWRTTDLKDFDHNLASFKLTGKHAATTCAQCHRNQVYRGTPSSCIACHAEPKIHQGRFGSDCAKCHSTMTWKNVNLTQFDHNLAAFHLTGKHVTTSCVACHKDQVYRGTPQSCAACHAEPTIHLGRFGNDCSKCHSTATWKNAKLASFNHDLSAFKLTGAHRTTACAACHKDQHYRGTPQSCVACHIEPKVHLGRFGTDCMKCHSTATWKGATITAEFHKFPIFHGGGKNRGECAACHAMPNDYRTYACYGCHRHEPEKTAEKHLKWNIIELQACAKCHPTGRKRPDQPAKEKARSGDRKDFSTLPSSDFGSPNSYQATLQRLLLSVPTTDHVRPIAGLRSDP